MAFILDIDGDGELNALTDGRLVLLDLFGLLDENTVASSIGPDATRTTLADIEGYLDSIRPLLDIDGDGEVDALSDGVLNVAHQIEVLEAVLQRAVREGAARTTSEEIGAYLDSLQNELPVAADDSATIALGTEGTIAVLENDSDPDGNPLTIIGVSDPVEGNNLSISENGDFLVYTPAADFAGEDSLLYTISDGRGGTASATVNVTAITNEPPVAEDDQAIVATGANAEISVLANDSDPDGDTLTIITVADPENGTVDIDGDRIIYSPNDEFAGTDSFAYSISDGVATDTATVTVTVQPADQPLTGSDGADVLIGDDNLTSLGATAEQIIGGAGDDVLVGGQGADQLTGGAGADRFEYLSLADSGADPAATLEAGDNIQDFDPTVDTIALLFDVAPGTPVTAADVTINLSFISNGLARIGLSALNTEDPETGEQFLPEQFTIRLNGLNNLENFNSDTIGDEIRNAIVFA
ncbi:MAG: Ig-like domain-containing protein [Hormoscilla sp.]